MNHRKKQRIFKKAIEPEYKRVYYFIYAHLGRDRELAADLTQDTMEAAWYKLEQLENIDAASAWLMQIAMNEMRKYFRAQNTRKRGYFSEESYEPQELERLEEPEQAEADVLDKIIAMEDGERLMAAMNQIPKTYLILLNLRLIQDLRFSQIAEIMEMEEAKARVYYSRGVKMLGKAYRRLTGEEEI